MDYVSCEEGRRLPGLRLVLSQGAPGPWGEAAKSIFHVRNVPFVAVAQKGMADNDDLFAWTGQRNAPVAMYEDEKPRHTAIDILYLAERIGSGPSLLPEDRALQVESLGLSLLLMGEDGLGWNRRLDIWALLLEEAGGDWSKTGLAPRAFKDYDGRPEALSAASARVLDILELFQARLAKQRDAGSDYLVGDRLTATDIHFATMFGMMDPLPPELCASPERSRRLYSSGSEPIRAAVTPELKAHRDFIYQRHLKLPMDF